MLDGPNDRKGKPIVIPEFDYTKCIGCQQCVDVCPVDCLHMEEIGYKTWKASTISTFRAKSNSSRNRLRSDVSFDSFQYSDWNCKAFMPSATWVSVRIAR